MSVLENKVNKSDRFGCFVCPQLRVGNSYRFNCGFVFEVPENKQLGGSETFYCENCKYDTHRDVNGARNILLKYMNIFPFH